MATELHDTLARLRHKSEVLIEKYRMLEAQNRQLAERLEAVEQASLQLRSHNERLEQENAFLRMAHAVAPTPEAAGQARAALSKIVRDIDRCISQLNT